MKPYTFEKAANTDAALRSKNEKAQFIAGGTNLVDLLKKNIAQPDSLIDITSAVSSEIVLSKKNISIGGMVRNTVLTTDKNILQNVPLIAKAVLAGASPQIRNMASTAGNLLQRTRCVYFYDITMPCNKRNPGSGCSALKGENSMSALVGYNEQCVAVHPSDLCVALVALDAEVFATSENKKKIKISFKDFHKLPENTPSLDNTLPQNALITHIEIPIEAFSKNFAYVKLRERTSYAFALVSVASALHLEGDKIIEARLASGGVAHKPWRWYEAENYLKGKKASAETFAKAASIATENIKPLSKNGYKIPMLKGAIETALQNSLKSIKNI